MFQAGLSNSIGLRRARRLFMLAATAGLIPLAMADTISFDRDFRLNSAAPAEILNFTAFDSSLGSLEGVQVTFDATRRNAWGLWNNAPASRSIAYAAAMTGSTLALDGNIFAFADEHYGPGATPVLGPTTALGFGTELLAGRADFLAGLDPVFASAFQPGTGLSHLTGSFLPLDFDGSLTLAYVSGAWTVSAGNFFSGSLVDVAGTATVTYSYRPTATIPDSPLGLAVAAWWGGMVLVAWFRRRSGVNAG